MKIRIGFLLAAALVLSTQSRAAEHTTDSLDTVKKNLAEKKAVLIDVRELAEWKRGHLEGAKLVPLSDLKKMADDGELQKQVEEKLTKKKIIYCHCASGFRVLSASDILGKLGYDIRPLAAGYKALRKAGFPPAKQEDSPGE